MSSLPKRLRFEILKRDHFACVYCGQGMPAVVVEVDHVLARANGGTDDPSNLVTACFACNRGKSDVPLDVALPGVTPESVEAMRLRAELMADYRRWQDEIEDQLRAELDRVWDAWADEFDGRSWTDDEGVRRWEADVAFPKDSTVLEFLRQLPTSEVLDAVRIAGWRWGKRRDEPIERAAVPRYFAGVCRNKARKADEAARQIHVTWPELLERVPELAAIHDEVASFEPSEPWTYCGDVLWTRGWTVTFDAASHRVEAPKDRISGLVGPRGVHAHDDVLGSPDGARPSRLHDPGRRSALRPDVRLWPTKASATRGGLPALRVVRPGHRTRRRTGVMRRVHDERCRPPFPARALWGGGVAPRRRDRPRLPPLQARPRSRARGRPQDSLPRLPHAARWHSSP